MPTAIPTHGMTKPNTIPITISAIARPIMAQGFPSLRDPN
jgi:hypothetical protein